MEIIKDQELYYKDYSWTLYNENDPKVSGKPDDTCFNKEEGLEVLYMVKNISSTLGFTYKKSEYKIEKMIHKFLPRHKRSQAQVVKWVLDHWTVF